jgi:hypothetical protein
MHARVFFPSYSRPQKLEPVANELLVVLARRSKVDEPNGSGLVVPQEIGPVWVRLHRTEDEKLVQAQVNNSGSNLDRCS